MHRNNNSDQKEKASNAKKNNRNYLTFRNIPAKLEQSGVNPDANQKHLIKAEDNMYKQFFGTYKHKKCDVKIFRCSADVGINRWGYEVIGHGFCIEEVKGNSQREAKELAIRWAECFRSKSFQLLGNLFEFEQVTNAEKLAAMDYERCQDFLDNRVVKALFACEHTDCKEQLILDWERMYAKTSFIAKELVEHVNDIRCADMRSRLKAEVERKYHQALDDIEKIPNFDGITIEWDGNKKGYRYGNGLGKSHEVYSTEEEALLEITKRRIETIFWFSYDRDYK